MIRPAKLLCKRLVNSMTITRGYLGGRPGCNLPWNMDSPLRFTAWWILWGTLGFGAPFLVVRHQLLRKDDKMGVIYLYYLRSNKD